jgi:serine/threonine protein kinase
MQEIRLELASNWSLLSYLRDHPEIGVGQRLHWARQVTGALCFVHAANVVHGDLTLNNVFLTQDLDAKVADYGGSSLDGSDLLVTVRASHRFPGTLLSTDADIFALGSARGFSTNLDLSSDSKLEEKLKLFLKELGRSSLSDPLPSFKRLTI